LHVELVTNLIGDNNVKFMTDRSNASKDDSGKLCYFIMQYYLFHIMDMLLFCPVYSKNAEESPTGVGWQNSALWRIVFALIFSIKTTELGILLTIARHRKHLHALSLQYKLEKYYFNGSIFSVFSALIFFVIEHKGISQRRVIQKDIIME